MNIQILIDFLEHKNYFITSFGNFCNDRDLKLLLRDFHFTINPINSWFFYSHIDDIGEIALNLCLLSEENNKRVLRDVQIFNHNTIKPHFEMHLKFAKMDIIFNEIDELIEILKEKNLIGEPVNISFFSSLWFSFRNGFELQYHSHDGCAVMRLSRNFSTDPKEFGALQLTRIEGYIDLLSKTWPNKRSQLVWERDIGLSLVDDNDFPVCRDFDSFVAEFSKRRGVHACTSKPVLQSGWLDRITKELLDTEQVFHKQFATALEKPTLDSVEAEFPALVPHIRTIVTHSSQFIDRLTGTDARVTSPSVDTVVDAFQSLLNPNWCMALFQYIRIYKEHGDQLNRMASSPLATFVYPVSRIPRYSLIISDMSRYFPKPHRQLHVLIAELRWLCSLLNADKYICSFDIVFAVSMALESVLPPYVVLEIVEKLPHMWATSSNEKIDCIISVSKSCSKIRKNRPI